MNKKLLLVQTTIATYRVPLIHSIKDSLLSNLTVFCGERFFDSTIRLSDNYLPDILLKNRFFLGNRFLWQSGLLKHGMQSGIMVLSLNPRVISNWILLILRKLFNKPTLVWGHAWPKNGQTANSDKLRHIMRLLSDEIIVYTHRQKEELQLRMPHKKIHVAPNALYSIKEMNASCVEQPRDIIFVSRMVENKKADLLYESFKSSIHKLPIETNLVLIGEGPERQFLIDKCKNDGLEGRVIIPGSVTDIEKLHDYYKSCLISVSPGRVGLSLTQSLGFGVPMIIAKEELHGPEIESAQQNLRTWWFKEDSVGDLSNKILTCFKQEKAILENRGFISDFCKKNYSIEAMASTFIKLVND